MPQQKKNLKPGRKDRAPPPPGNPNFRPPTPAPFIDPNPHIRPPPPPPPPSAPSSQGGQVPRRNDPSPPRPDRPSLRPPPLPSPYAPRRTDPPSNPFGPPRRDPLPSPYGPHQTAPPGSAFSPGARESEPLSRALDGMSLYAPVGERYSAYDPRATPRIPQPGDSNYEQPLPYVAPHPSERSQPIPPGRSGHGTSSTKLDTRSQKAKGTTSGAPTRKLLPRSGRETAHKEPSPPENPGQVKRRRTTTTSEVASSLQEREAPQDLVWVDETLPGGPNTTQWTQNEDDALRRVMQNPPLKKKKGGIDWDAVSSKIWMKEGVDRSYRGCRARWERHIGPQDPKVLHWSDEEDKELRKLMKELRKSNTKVVWKEISDKISKLGVYRGPDACRHHYEHLKAKGLI